MAALSNTHAIELINYSLRNSTVYMALYLNDPGADASGTEVSGTGYGRVAITLGVPSIVGGKATSSNTNAVNFGTAGSAWGTVAYWAIYSASTGGQLLWYGAFSRSKTIEINDSVVVAIGELDVTLS